MSVYKNVFNENENNTSWSLAYDFVNEGDKVLEVGSGNGNFAKALVNHKNCDLVCIEPDEGDAKLAQKKIKRVINKTIEESIADLKGEKFDKIVFLDVIEHLLNPVEVIYSLKKILKPKGKIVFSLPNMGHTSVRIMIMSGEYVYGDTGILDKTHLYFYTDTQINKVFNEAGFFVDDMRYVEKNIKNEVIEHELIKKGIKKPSKDLIKLLQSKNGNAYQYVGMASVSKSKKYKKITPPLSPNLGQLEKSYAEDEISHLRDVIKNQQLEIEKINSDKDYFQKTLSDITNSKTWKAANAIKSHIKKKRD